ncbi:MAG: stage 0 sporulation protein [Clostridia bacterium]|nr:stage 0 sporulation protein [Clostridia bacterium]
MVRIVGIRFKDNGKIYDFDAKEFELRLGERVIVRTSQGIECGTVAESVRVEREENLTKELKPIVRIADEDDYKILEIIERREKEAYAVCEQQIAQFGLEMTLVSVEHAFDGSKIIFYYTAPKRVDFRELVRSLASTLRCRIELRQIGVRNETSMIGGLGMCGQPFCCSRFLNNNFKPVSIRMAKEQGISMGSAKISGACGRLMCCLNFEDETYRRLIKMTPPVGAVVATPDGEGVVTDVKLLTGVLSVKLNASPDAVSKYSREDVTVLKMPVKKQKTEELSADS